MESYWPDRDLSRGDMGCNLWYISDLENFDGELPLLSLSATWSLAGLLPRAEVKGSPQNAVFFFFLKQQQQQQKTITRRLWVK